MNEARTIERLAVDSSNLKAVGYDEGRQILSIEFNSGSIFHYYQVPLETFEQLGKAESRGAFYAKQVRGRFHGKPMTGMCAKCQRLGLIGETCQVYEEAPWDKPCGGEIREVDRTHKE